MPEKRSKEQEYFDHLSVILEDMRFQFNLFFESQRETNQKIGDLRGEFNDFKKKVDRRFTKVDTRFNRIDGDFKSVFGYLVKIEDEIKELKSVKKEVEKIKKDRKVDSGLIRKIEKKAKELEKGFDFIKKNRRKVLVSV